MPDRGDLDGEEERGGEAEEQKCPRAPAGKKPLMIITNEDLIKDSKIAAIEDDRNVSAIVQELLQGWLAERKSRRQK
jgi:hypothetical protein